MKASTLETGTLALYESLYDMIPCKVLSITGRSGNPSSSSIARFQLTATRGPWKRGEILESWTIHVCPRDAYRPSRQTIHPYQVVADTPAPFVDNTTETPAFEVRS